ncbi:multiple inositol polyphosphate phosphatase 1-like [Strongylocentrotus purpuratus]|uniref:Multiple inositol polyphosphate phosphatase 1 n=1 Tax=Strongylocentrotus purpuratus TaxID=7668 RepID=A0A7M7NH71_STRPU|nr:multiple inositol polyphosphate phosphatase 1-like [Strongylocentrotus purpuratus]
MHRLAILITVVVCVYGQGPTARYSTKTGYETSFEPGTDEKNQRLRDWQTIASDVGESASVTGCKPVGVYAVNRHGMRYASDSDIEDYNAILARMKMTGVSEEFAYLLNITDNLYPIALESSLHPAGFAEMEGLGMRIKQRLPELFVKDGLDGFDFQGTYRQRTVDSAQGFINGLQGPTANCSFSSKTPTRDTLTCTFNSTANSTANTETVAVDHELEGKDLLLKFYESCTKFITDVDDNDAALMERDRFEEGPELTSAYKAVATKLAPIGWTGPWNMTKNDLEVMHHMCGYESAYYGSSPWCNLFLRNESLAVEYWLDLKQYWKEGYGYDINYQMACPLVDDVVEYMTTVKKNGTRRGSFKFGHSSTLQPFLTILGLYKDTPKLLANNYDVSVNRAFRSGRISPMTGHVSFNVLQCPSDQYRVLVLHNELPIKLGTCGEFFCPYDDVVSHLEMSSNGCRFDALCGTNGLYPGVSRADTLSKMSILTLMVTLLVSFFVLQ